jgi:hypothetical protein
MLAFILRARAFGARIVFIFFCAKNALRAFFAQKKCVRRAVKARELIHRDHEDDGHQSSLSLFIGHNPCAGLAGEGFADGFGHGD